MSAWGFSQATT